MRHPSASRIRRRFQRLSRIRGQVPHALRTLSPLGASLRHVRLACLIHAASVHSEPGSNSPSLKSPNGNARRRRHPVDSIINQLKDFIGEEPHASHGEPFHQKNHVRSYCAARFPKSRRAVPPFFVTPITLHRLSAFASGAGDFFHGKATPDVLKQKFDVSESTHSVPISQETP